VVEDGERMGQPTVAANETETAPPLTRGERVVAWLLPSLGDVVFVCALFVGTLGLQGRILGVDGDVGWNIALGTITLEHGLPRTEPFLSGMLGQPTTHWEWLAQVIYALGYRIGGLNGVVTIASLLIATALLGLYHALRRRGASALPAVALTLAGAVLVAMTWTARAQLFSLLFTFWWAEWLWRYWRDGRTWRLWLFPAVTALWVNFHAGWLGGIVLLTVATALAWLTPPTRRMANAAYMALALVGSLLATLLNPWGIGYWRHLLTFTFNPLVATYTQEYQSPNFHIHPLLIYLALVFALVVVWLQAARAGRRIDPLALAVCGVWTALGFMYVRFVPLWPLICLPYLVEALPASMKKSVEAEATSDALDWRMWLLRWLRGIARRLAETSARVDRVEQMVGRGVWPLVAIVLAALLVLNGGRVPGQTQPLLHAQWDMRAFPVAAVQRLRTEGLPVGRGYNPYEWGGYLDEALPAYHVFIDSRSDVYSQRFLADYITITNVSPGWNRLLDHYQVRWALLPTSAPLREALTLAGWQCHSEDDQGIASVCMRPAAQQALYGQAVSGGRRADSAFER
jgi:hypothetical protein